ncbi:reverse transcriptase domain-containing protein [Nephila pilipes]|uniref:Reverse transcriptase domain-containing protein n=1 Tax=Nephila pilipes TaxID=299642 RepID=A0A8X6PN98_NEPPI|nr:reverse transcriptase domain-containing protein [Nephila pilipes]
MCGAAEILGELDLGCPSAAMGSYLYLIDSAFKLLNSPDKEVANLALAQLTRTVRYRIQRDPTNHDLASFMSGSMEADFNSSTNARQNTWTQARKASSRIGVTWSFADGIPSVQKNDVQLRPHMRKRVMKNLPKLLRYYEVQELLEFRAQGKVMGLCSVGQGEFPFSDKWEIHSLC